MATKAALPGRLRLANADNSNDPFPNEMREAIKKAVSRQGLNNWHIELSIDTLNNSEESGKVRFKLNFPDGMRETIRQNLGTDDWCLQMKLKDGDGGPLDATGDDDGTAAGLRLEPGAAGAAKTASRTRTAGPKNVALRHKGKSTRGKATTRPTASKSARSASKKRSGR